MIHYKKTDDEELPWYLKRNTVWLFAVVFPPLAYLLVFFNKQKFNSNTTSGLTFFTTLMLGVWVLKLLPHNPVTLTLVIGAVLFSFLLLVIKFVKTNNE